MLILRKQAWLEPVDPENRGQERNQADSKQQHDAGTDCLVPYIRPGFFVLSNKVSGTGGLMPNA